MNDGDVQINTIAETDNYTAWTTEEEEGEIMVHIELGQVTLHLYQDEWEEMLALVEAARDALEGE